MSNRVQPAPTLIRRRHSLTVNLVLGSIMALTVFSFRSALLAQSSEQKPSSTQSSPQGSQAKQPEDMGAQLAEQSQEAAGEAQGENDELKKSAAVSFVARVTGMSLEHAYWLCMVLNFAVIAGVIVWFSRTKLPGVFRNRTASIQKAMEEARKASEDANRRLSEIEARLARLDTEIGSMRATAEQEAAAEEARIKAAAEEDTRKIIEAAEQEVAAAAKTARRDLKAFAANLSVELAERMIRVDPATDHALVRNFSDQLGSETNGSGSGKDGR
jgi:F-type H+-transporting ATPase subunit b